MSLTWVVGGGGHVAVIQVGWSSTLGVVVSSSLTLGVVVVVLSTLMVGGHVDDDVGGDGGHVVDDVGGG